MEKFSPKPKDPTKAPEKKVYKAGVVDVSALAKAQARDVADARMTESKEDRSANWFVKNAKRFWKHNVAQEWYRNREIERVKKEIAESGNLYAGESKDSSIKDYDKAKLAIIERFTSEYEDEMLRKEEKESKNSVTDENAKKAIKDLIKQFAGDTNMSEAAFTEAQNRILAASNPEYAQKGKMYASNLVEIAKEVRNAVTHGEKLAEMDFDVEITLGQARESLNTEAKHNSFEKIIEKTQNSKLGKYLFNEPAGVAIAAGLYSAANFLGVKVLRSNLAKIGTFGATALLAGGISASKEAARLNRERAQHMRESAKGMEFKEDDMKRRKEMDENKYETKKASEIITSLEGDLQKVSTENIKEADLDAILVNLSDLEARIARGDKDKVDLISYTKFNTVEEERMKLDVLRAKLKVGIRKGIADGRVEFKKTGTFDNYIKQLSNTQSESFTGDIKEKNKAFAQMKVKKVAWAFAKSALIGAAAGVAFQEVRAAFQDEVDGIFEGAFKSGELTHKATALEGLRRWITDDAPRLPFGKVHEMMIGDTHMKLPEGVEMTTNPDGTFDILRGGTVIGDNLKLEFEANGDLTAASKDLLAENHILSGFAQTGGTISETITTTPEDYMKNHPEGMKDIHRVWMDNDTPAPVFDQNELKLEWGGVGGTGIDADGNYVFNVNHMTPDGSFHEGLSVDAQEQLKKGGLEVLLSVTRGTQNMVIPVHIDQFGKAVIDHTTEAGKMLFHTDANGHAVFDGAFAEVGHMTSTAADGAENMRILATHIGTDHANSVTETIVTDTTEPNVSIGVPDDWDYDMPPVFPIVLPRRPLEKGEYGKDKPGKEKAPDTQEPIPYAPYYQYYGAGMDRKKWRDDFSPRLKNNPEADLNPKEEFSWYFNDQKRRNPGYVEGELARLEAQNPEPLGKKVEAIVCVAAAGHQEHANIYKTLDTYRVQKDPNGESVWKGTDDNKFEIFLYVNWPKGKDPQKTFDEIERFKTDHPGVKVRVYKEEINTGKVELGWLKKKIFDVALKKHADSNNGRDILLITNDADMTSASSSYLEKAIDSLNNPANNKMDAVLARFDLDPEVYKKNPTFHSTMKFWQFMESVMRSKYGFIGTQGRNTIMRGSSYAAVGGNRTREFWADIEFAQLFDEARNRSSVVYSNAPWLNVDPRREIDKFKSGEKVAHTWSTDFDTRDVRGNKISKNLAPENLDVAELAELKENDPKVVEFKKRLQEELQEIVNLFSKITPGFINAPADSGVNKQVLADIKMLAERSAGFLGVTISLKENGKDDQGNTRVVLNIVDSKKLRQNLKEYNEKSKDQIKLLKKEVEKKVKKVEVKKVVEKKKVVKPVEVEEVLTDSQRENRLLAREFMQKLKMDPDLMKKYKKGVEKYEAVKDYKNLDSKSSRKALVDKDYAEFIKIPANKDKDMDTFLKEAISIMNAEFARSLEIIKANEKKPVVESGRGEEIPKGGWMAETKGKKSPEEVVAKIAGILDMEPAGETFVNEKGEKVTPLKPIEKKESENEQVLTAKELEDEVKINMQNLLDKIKDKDPELKKFIITEDGNDKLKMESEIDLKNTEIGKVTIKLNMSLENRGGKLSLGKHTIDAGFLATGKVKKQLEPQLKNLIPGIQEYFEQKAGKEIESMTIENGGLKIEYKV